MPIVDIEKLARETKKADDDRHYIRSKLIGDKSVYKGPIIDDWFDTADECLVANQEAARLKEYKRLGLDEMGRTAAQVRLANAKAALLRKKEQILDQIREIDKEIASLSLDDFDDEKEEKKLKKK